MDPASSSVAVHLASLLQETSPMDAVQGILQYALQWQWKIGNVIFAQRHDRTPQIECRPCGARTINSLQWCYWALHESGEAREWVKSIPTEISSTASSVVIQCGVTPIGFFKDSRK
jgi:hypothetical protein